MIKTFQIEFVRKALESKLASYVGNTNLFNDDDIVIFSFYEHLVSDAEVERYVELYRELVNEQNRADKIGYGIIATTDTPSITNLKSVFVSPFEWTCNIRCEITNRDKMLTTIYQLISDLKGRKIDVAQLDNGKLLVVGTIDSNIKNYDYIGEVNSATYATDIATLISTIISNGTTTTISGLEYLYASCGGKIKLYRYITNAWVEQANAVEEHNSFEKYKIDLGFDDIKCTEPYTLNEESYIDITFGGTATLTNSNVRLGNDMVKLFIGKNYIRTSDTETYSFEVDDKIVYTELEPLELSSGNSGNDIQNQLRSNFFKTNSHTDSISLTLQYSFVCDMSIDFISSLFDYARYGENDLGDNNELQQTSITPNIVYSIKELWSSWGEVKVKTIKTKIVGDISIENTESDIMSMTLTMQIQGDND